MTTPNTRFVHDVYARLSDADLLLCMDAVRRELRDPPVRSDLLFGIQTSALDLTRALSYMQDEYNHRHPVVVKAEEGNTPGEGT